MSRAPFIGMLLAAALVAAGCTRATAPAARPVEAAGAGIAQPKLPTLKLWLGAHEISAELALTAEQQRMGMMFRAALGEEQGMLFVFPAAHEASFWMKNTTVPLSAAYIAPDGAILEIRDLKPLDETSVRAGTDRVQYVLEVPQGWFQRHGVTNGAVIRTERGSLRETFFGRNGPSQP